MADFTISSTARLPALKAVLYDANGVMDLSGASAVKLYTRKNGIAFVNGSSCTIVDAVGGTVSYAWGSSDTTTPGTYQMQFEVTIGGLLLRIPTDGYYYLDVIPKA